MLFKKNQKKKTHTQKQFLFFIFLLLLSEIYLFEGFSLLESSNSIRIGRSVPFSSWLAEQPDLTSFLAFFCHLFPCLGWSFHPPALLLLSLAQGWSAVGIAEIFGDGVRDTWLEASSTLSRLQSLGPGTDFLAAEPSLTWSMTAFTDTNQP